MSRKCSDGKKEASLTRRQFLQATGAVTIATAVSSKWKRSSAYALAGGSDIVGANERIGIGAIGCGGRGTHLIRVVLDLKKRGENVDVVAVCDIYRPRLDRAVSITNAKAYRDYRELLDDPNVDAVLIATPDRWHVYQALDAVRAGKDVYCEKPLTHWAQFKQLKRLVREVGKRERIFQIGTQGMSDSVWHQAAELIAQGAIGDVVHVQAGYFRRGDWGERMRIDDRNAQPGPDLDWEAFLADAPKRPFSVSRFFQWRMYWDYSGGPATDLFPHTLTPIVKALGVKFPKQVVASGGKYHYNGVREVPDTFDMLIEYPEGISVVLMCTLANEHGIPTLIRGYEATMFFEAPGIVIRPQRRVALFERKIPRKHGGSDHEHWRNFLKCMRTREQPYSHIELGYYVQTALIMGVLSYREGKVARFDAERERIVM